jgi:hypothetical protein
MDVDAGMTNPFDHAYTVPPTLPPERVLTKHAGLLLCIGDLVALDLPAIVKAAGYPGTTGECHKVCVRRERMEPHAFNTPEEHLTRASLL